MTYLLKIRQICRIFVVMKDEKLNIAEEIQVRYGLTDDRKVFAYIEYIEDGITYNKFDEFTKESPFTQSDWANFLQISTRTFQRYKKEKRSFEPIYSERILQVMLLYIKGIEVFENKKSFYTWLNTDSIALGGKQPISLLSSTFGINMLRDELTRIEHGVLS